MYYTYNQTRVPSREQIEMVSNSVEVHFFNVGLYRYMAWYIEVCKK